MSPHKIVLLSCGSFNPITHMHLRLFELAKDHLTKAGCQVIGGIISPVHDSYTKADLVSSSHRCALIKLAVQDSEWIQLSDWECSQPTWTPSLQVLQYHQNKLNSLSQESGNKRRSGDDDNEPNWMSHARKCITNHTKISVKLLCGADLLESFAVPGLWAEKDIENIIGEHGLVTVSRSGSDPHKFIYESDVLSRHQNDIFVVTEWITNEVSSTKIRRSLRRGESVKYLVPNDVIDYIKNNGLYVASNKNGFYANHTSPTPTSPSSDVIMAIDTPDAAEPGIATGVETKRARPGRAVALRKAMRTACRQ